MASGLAWEMSFRLLGARPWFTLLEPRVFRLAALRPGSLRLVQADEG